MGEVDLLVVFIPFVHGEVDDPAELELVLVHQPEVGPDLGAREPCELVEAVRLASSEEDRIARRQAELRPQRLRALRAQVLGHRPGAALLVPSLLVWAPEDVGHAGLVLALGPVVHAIAEGAAPATGRRDSPDLRLRVLQDASEDAEAAAAEVLGHLLHLDGVAQVRLVGAVLAHRLAEGDVREGADGCALACPELLEHAPHHRLDDVEHVLLRDEAHLHVELVKLSRRTVRARRLVAEAGRDLEVAVEPRDHQQLLELLRRLGQRIELAGIKPGGNQIIPRALG